MHYMPVVNYFSLPAIQCEASYFESINEECRGNTNVNPPINATVDQCFFDVLEGTVSPNLELGTGGHIPIMFCAVEDIISTFPLTNWSKIQFLTILTNQNDKYLLRADLLNYTQYLTVS